MTQAKQLILAVAAAAILLSSAYGGTTNISTRANVGVNGNMIAGFILPHSAATVVIRALGPTLVSYGVRSTLTDPNVAVFNEQRKQIAFNNDYRVRDFQGTLSYLQPNFPDESAIVLHNVQAGQYTAVVRGTIGDSGNALVEVYIIQ